MHVYKKRIFQLILLLVLWPCFAVAQQQSSGSRAIYGRIVDAVTGKPVAGAGVVLMDESSQRGTTSDKSGFFHLRKVSYGFQTLRIHSMGYNTVWLPTMWVQPGIMPFITVRLRRQVLITDRLLIPGHSKNQPGGIMAGKNARKTDYHTLTHAAADLDDPFNVLNWYTGATVAAPDNPLRLAASPAQFTAFRVDEIPVPSFSHLSGIYSPSGYQSIIPTEIVEQAVLYNTAPPASLGNAHSGMADLSLQEGHYTEPGFSAQIGSHASGIGYNGPLIQNRVSVLAGYRHGTGKLLQEKARNLFPGDNQPFWHDAHLKLSAFNPKGGKLTLTALGGISSFTAKKGKSYPYSLAGYNPYHRLFHKTKQGGAGLTYHHYFTDHHWLTTSLHAGLYEVQLHGDTLSPQDESVPVFGQGFTHARYGLETAFHYKQDARNVLSAGARVRFSNLYLSDSLQFRDGYRKYTAVDANYWNVQAFGEWQHRLDDQISLYLALTAKYVFFNRQLRIAPRAWASWKITPKQTLSLEMARQYRLYQPANYFHKAQYAPEMYAAMNRDMPLTHTTSASLGYHVLFHKNLELRNRVWFRNIARIPVPAFPEYHIPALSPRHSHYFLFDTLYAEGYTSAKGIDAALIHSGNTRYHYRLGLSYKQADFNPFDGRNYRSLPGNGFSAFVGAGYRHNLGKKVFIELNLASRFFQEPPAIKQSQVLTKITRTPYPVFKAPSAGFLPVYALMHAELRIVFNQRYVGHTLNLEAKNLHFQEMPWENTPGFPKSPSLPFFPAISYKLAF